MSTLNTCRGGTGARSGGAHWTNYATCKTCGKRVFVNKSGVLRAHGTRRPDWPAIVSALIDTQHDAVWAEGRKKALEDAATALAETQRSCHSSETDETKPAIG
jgi:hypothetical protein